MVNYLLKGVRISFLTLLLFGVVYPLLITGISMVLGPGGGEGKKITLQGKTVGFEVIGQSFTSEKYFNGRPSAVNYNSAATGGSNKGPSNPEYLAEVRKRMELFLAANPTIRKDQLPIDLITASGGGLDPHISPAGAQVQVARIAHVRGVSEEIIRKLVEEHLEKPVWGLLGPSRINVLKLNMALDALQ